ncbi:MAG: hypothetical protein PHE93_06230 [Clostridia bacterium]|nr:hypothetical protein [Clostridia bacterium]
MSKSFFIAVAKMPLRASTMNITPRSNYRYLLVLKPISNIVLEMLCISFPINQKMPLRASTMNITPRSNYRYLLVLKPISNIVLEMLCISFP